MKYSQSISLGSRSPVSKIMHEKVQSGLSSSISKYQKDVEIEEIKVALHQNILNSPQEQFNQKRKYNCRYSEFSHKGKTLSHNLLDNHKLNKLDESQLLELTEQNVTTTLEIQAKNLWNQIQELEKNKKELINKIKDHQNLQQSKDLPDSESTYEIYSSLAKECLAHNRAQAQLKEKITEITEENKNKKKLFEDESAEMNIKVKQLQDALISLNKGYNDIQKDNKRMVNFLTN